MNLLIFGSRSFDDYSMLQYNCDQLIATYSHNDILIITGGARGADTLGAKWAAKRQLDNLIMPARWDSEGKKTAGISRNIRMGDACTSAIGFWDEVSNGSYHMMRYLLRVNKPFIIINVSTGEKKCYNGGTERIAASSIT